MGALLHQAVLAHEKLKEASIGARIYNISSPLNITREKIAEAAKTGLIITYEDHIITSGIGSLIAQIIAEENIQTKFVKVGITLYGGSDTADVLYKKHSLDADSLVKIVKNT
jgi:transketolase